MLSSDSMLKVVAPLSGPVLPIESVPDPVFAQKMVGPGMAIDPTSEILLAPFDGTIVQLHRAHHAITVQSACGAQVLMHIGLDTVKLNGRHFHPKVRLGDKVKCGQPLIEFEADEIARKAKSLITVIVVNEADESQFRWQKPVRVDAGQDVVLEISNSSSEGTPFSVDNNGRSLSEEILVQLPAGLHARPSALLAAQAKNFQSEIGLQKNGGQLANAKSVVGIMGLEIACGDRVRLRAKGADAQQAIEQLSLFLRDLREQPEHGHKPKPVSTLRTNSDPNVLVGIGVSPGVSIGRIAHVRSEFFSIPKDTDRSPAAEAEFLHKALAQAARQLEDLAEQVKNKTDKSRAAIFASHRELLSDPDLIEQSLQMIALGRSAAFAWNHTLSDHANRLSSLNNELMANRANDLRDINRRVLRLLSPSPAPSNSLTNLGPNTILVAESLTPSETVQIDRNLVIGFCTTTGGATSHVAILARSLGLPAIAGIDTKALELEDGTEVILDGESGDLRLNPSADEMNKAEQLQREQQRKRQSALEGTHQKAVTADGHRVEVAANIGGVADARQAVEMGAEAVGLLRSEFLFLERDTAPSEEEQLAVYQEIADILGSRTLVIRTLDVGGDKPLQYLPIDAEENPFLGVRGIRVGFLHPEVLRQQLRAILRVRHRGKLAIMFPMISTIEEFRQAKAILEEEREKLAAPSVEVGIMVEVPSVALTADVFAREVDFFSVGTNDLTQYTLAMDRGHKGLAKQVDALHPSVLKLIQLSVEAAHRHGKWVGVCGGLASDTHAVPLLIGLGVDELSVSIPSVPLVKACVRESHMNQAKSQAEKALSLQTAKAVREMKG